MGELVFAKSEEKKLTRSGETASPCAKDCDRLQTVCWRVGKKAYVAVAQRARVG